MIAQLRDVLAAEQSTVVTKKDEDGRVVAPQAAETHEVAIRVRQCDAADRRGPRSPRPRSIGHRVRGRLLTHGAVGL